jgi:hypothetical protein
VHPWSKRDMISGGEYFSLGHIFEAVISTDLIINSFLHGNVHCAVWFARVVGTAMKR